MYRLPFWFKYLLMFFFRKVHTHTHTHTHIHLVVGIRNTKHTRANSSRTVLRSYWTLQMKAGKYIQQAATTTTTEMHRTDRNASNSLELFVNARTHWNCIFGLFVAFAIQLKSKRTSAMCKTKNCVDNNNVCCNRK